MGTASPEETFEMTVGSSILRLHSRVFEIFSTESSHTSRWHVKTVAFAARPPDRHGQVEVRVGLVDKDGELSMGSERVGLKLDTEQWESFQALVAAVKREQARNPEGW